VEGVVLRWIVALTVIVVASGLMFLGTPRLIASILKAPAHVLLTHVEAGKTPPRDQLERAANHLEQARSWENSAQLASEIGFLRLLDAFQMDSSDPRRAAEVRLSADSLRESLRLSPARPHPWVRLAYAEDFEVGPGAEIARLLQQSTMVGAYVGEVALVRLRLLLKYWDSLSPEMRLYTFKQIRYMWANDQGFVLQAGKQTSKSHLIRFALRLVPGALDRFDQVVPPPAK
jgi:hypothetical protein